MEPWRAEYPHNGDPEAHNGALLGLMEPWRAYIPTVADSHHCDEKRIRIRLKVMGGADPQPRVFEVHFSLWRAGGYSWSLLAIPLTDLRRDFDIFDKNFVL
jgi:hypothetical protein